MTNRNQSWLQRLNDKVRNSPAVIMVALVALLVLLVGLIHFAEDTHSSYDGIIQIERYFGITPALFQIVYITASITPQLGQVIFGYIYLASPSRERWALYLASAFFLIDLISDVQAHSGNQLFPAPGVDRSWMGLAVTTLMTLMYYTIGSELFISAGIAIFTEVFVDAVREALEMYIKLYEISLRARLRLEEISSQMESLREQHMGQQERRQGNVRYDPPGDPRQQRRQP